MGIDLRDQVVGQRLVNEPVQRGNIDRITNREVRLGYAVGNPTFGLIAFQQRLNALLRLFIAGEEILEPKRVGPEVIADILQNPL